MLTQDKIIEMLDELMFSGRTILQIEKEARVGLCSLRRAKSGARELGEKNMAKFILYYEDKIGKKDIIRNESRWDELEKQLDTKLK